MGASLANKGNNIFDYIFEQYSTTKTSARSKICIIGTTVNQGLAGQSLLYLSQIHPLISMNRLSLHRYPFKILRTHSTHHKISSCHSLPSPTKSLQGMVFTKNGRSRFPNLFKMLTLMLLKRRVPLNRYIPMH